MSGNLLIEEWASATRCQAAQSKGPDLIVLLPDALGGCFDAVVGVILMARELGACDCTIGAPKHSAR